MDEIKLYLDRNEEISINTNGRLPHWHQEEKIQFITFRLADSLPRKKQEEIKQIIENFKSRNPGEWTKTQHHDYRKTISAHIEQLLNNAYGECILKKHEIRKIVSDNLNYHNGKKYQLIAYVIMPNHIHLLIRPLANIHIKNIIHSIKSYTAKQINLKLNRVGSVWMPEYYDHIVRSPDELKHFINYIRNNPSHLPEGTFELYII